jgi:excisionase family DNA binding protein
LPYAALHVTKNRLAALHRVTEDRMAAVRRDGDRDGDDEGRRLSVDEAARAVGVSRATINGWIQAGLVPSTLTDRRRSLRLPDLSATHAREHADGVLPTWRTDPARAGRRLRRLREAAGCSQLALAAASGVSHEAISVLEHGKRPATGPTIWRLATALGIDPVRFVDNTPIGLATLTVGEAAQRLGVPEQRLQRWLKEGQLPGHKVARQWRIPEIALTELERSGRMRGASRRLDPRYRG